VRLVQRFHVAHQHVIPVNRGDRNTFRHVPQFGRANVSEELGGGLVRVLLHYGFMQVARVPAALGPTLAQAWNRGAPGEIAYIVGRETLVAAQHGTWDG